MARRTRGRSSSRPTPRRTGRHRPEPARAPDRAHRRRRRAARHPGEEAARVPHPVPHAPARRSSRVSRTCRNSSSAASRHSATWVARTNSSRSIASARRGSSTAFFRAAASLFRLPAFAGVAGSSPGRRGPWREQSVELAAHRARRSGRFIVLSRSPSVTTGRGPCRSMARATRYARALRSRGCCRPSRRAARTSVPRCSAILSAAARAAFMPRLCARLMSMSAMAFSCLIFVFGVASPPCPSVSTSRA